MAAEVAEHAALEDVLELGPVFGSESGGLVEADLSCVALGNPKVAVSSRSFKPLHSVVPKSGLMRLQNYFTNHYLNGQ